MTRSSPGIETLLPTVEELAEVMFDVDHDHAWSSVGNDTAKTIYLGDARAALDFIRGRLLRASLQPATPTAGDIHRSDCAAHNAPALPVGPCDCGAELASSGVNSPSRGIGAVGLVSVQDTPSATTSDAVADQACPYKGPFGCKCEPGECKYRAGGDAVAAEAQELDWSGPCCPFCGGDPFHRTDAGEAVAVVCCDLGDLFFRGARKAPEEVTLSWEDFTEIGSRLAGARHLAQSEREPALVEFFKWAMREGPWEGGDLDGGSIQDKAESLGLIVKTKFDPEKHGTAYGDFSDGDDYYEFAPGVSIPSTQNSPPGRLTSQNTAERLPSSDAAILGGETVSSPPRDTRPDWKQDKDETSLLPRGAGK